MTSEQGLHVLLVMSLVASCLLFLIAMAMVGRKITDLDYQRMKGLNGTMRIQAIVNLRTQSLRVLVGVTFCLFAVLLLADAPMVWRQWVNRTLFVVVPAAYLAACLLDWFAEHEQLRIELGQEQARNEARARQIVEAERERTAILRSDRDIYREMASEAIASLEAAAARMRESKGESPSPIIAPVVPEHSSPVSLEQQAEADRQTMRAKLTASTLALDLPARTVNVPETGVDVASIQSGAIADITDAVKAAQGDPGEPER